LWGLSGAAVVVLLQRSADIPGQGRAAGNHALQVRKVQVQLLCWVI